MVASIDTAIQCAGGPGHQPRRLEFPGCLEVCLTRAEVEQYEGHIEFWDARIGLAMVAEPPTALAHELPAQRLAKLATLIAAARGSPIEMFGATDLLQLAGDGEWRRIMQPDQIVYLNPGEHTPPGSRIKVGEDRLPDVVLEVDNTTDVRRGKLYIYESWGFPELWVEVPDKPARSRPKSLRPGLTIYALERGRFVETPVSHAFPGWTTAEIHRAMNEPALSEETAEVLRRVGRRMGAAVGTGPDDDPFLDAELRESRAEVLHEALQQVFAARGISVSWTSRNSWPMELERAAVERVMQAALECRNGDDFLKRLRTG